MKTNQQDSHRRLYVRAGLVTVIREPLGDMAAGRWYSAKQLSELAEIPGTLK